jgi:hypothetical protein
MASNKKTKSSPGFTGALAEYIHSDQIKAIRKILSIVEANSAVKVIAIDVPSDEIIFGWKYVKEQERLLEEKEMMISALEIEELEH